MVPDLDALPGTTVDWLKSRARAATAEEAFSRLAVVGFTVCPPKGAELSQQDISESLNKVLLRGLPTALYQLPQVTENEMTPDTVHLLADAHPNLFLFKDTSGRDIVARAQLDPGGVFLVRGAEGEYARSTRNAGGPYDGLLLSTANVFAPRFHECLQLLDDGRHGEAEALSERVERVVHRTFALVADFGTGNPFTNANKVLDHLMAHGSSAAKHPPPLLYGGVRLPTAFVEQADQYLRAAHLLPATGYLHR